MMLADSDLKGARILVVEDDGLLVKLAEDTLAELGCVVTGTATSFAEALDAINQPDSFDCVVLDVRLGRDLSGDIAGQLAARNIPFIVCSGYSISLPGTNIPIVTKPYTTEVLGQALRKALRPPCSVPGS
jgi:CheY-like chemotaxis protein